MAGISRHSGDRHGLGEVRNDILDILVTHRHANHGWLDAGGKLLLRRQLLVRGGAGVNDEGLGVAHIRQVRGQLQAVDKTLTRVLVPPQPERQHRT